MKCNDFGYYRINILSIKINETNIKDDVSSINISILSELITMEDYAKEFDHYKNMILSSKSIRQNCRRIKYKHYT